MVSFAKLDLKEVNAIAAAKISEKITNETVWFTSKKTPRDKPNKMEWDRESPK